MATLQALAERFDCQDMAVAFPEIDIPVLTGMQRQGDILVVPSCLPEAWPTDGPVPMDGGVVITQSAFTDHTHTMYGDGQVWVMNAEMRATSLWCWDAPNTLAWLKVPDGGEAFLMHSDEHGALGIGPGTYRILRQQEFNNEWTDVED